MYIHQVLYMEIHPIICVQNTKIASIIKIHVAIYCMEHSYIYIVEELHQDDLLLATYIATFKLCSYNDIYKVKYVLHDG